MRKFKSISVRMAGVLLLLLSSTWLLAGIELKMINNPQELPVNLSYLARSGDYLINDGKYLFLLAREGRDFEDIKYYPAPDGAGAILAAIPVEENLTNYLIAGPVQVRIGFDYYYPSYAITKTSTSKTKGAPLTLELKADLNGRHQEKAEIKTSYKFVAEKGQVVIKSTFKNTGQEAIDQLALSLYFNAFHSYHFNPYHQKSHPELNFRVYQKKGLYLGWVNLGSKPAELPKKLLPGQTIELNYLLLVRKEPEDLLHSIYSELKKEVLPVEIVLKNSEGKENEIVVEETLTSTIFFRSFVRGSDSHKIYLPEGIYRLRANFFPAVVEKNIRVSKSSDLKFELERPASGFLRIKLVDRKGNFLPGKISVFGLEGTKSPYFSPENPLDSGRSWERFKNSVYAVSQPLEIELMAGRYLVNASYGPLYTTEGQVLEILEGQKSDVTFCLKKAVDLRGYIALDPHLHTINSDGTLSVPERIKSIVAENLEAAIATDHNFVTDYRPELEKLGLDKYLKVFSGEEVTPLNNYLHFNNYPVALKVEEKTRGAILTRFEKVKELFQACLKNNPSSLLQLNHPRAGNLGYFENIGLDKEKAAYASGDLELSFDLLEVMNGASFHRGNDQAVTDWLNLLNKGYYFPAVGSSDSHGAAGGEPGYSRVFVRCSKKLKDLNWEDLALGLKKGQSFVSNGPVVEFVVNRKFQPGDLLTDKDGKIKARVKVLSAPWIDISEVRIIINGERKITFPVNSLPVEPLKFDKKLEITLNRDAYLVVEVIGQRTLYPVVQQPADNGKLEEAALPYALTNPVFVDVDGNGRFDPPWPPEIEIRK